ncbi:hypothetical protein D3C76_1312490 [compost metagenome]
MVVVFFSDHRPGVDQLFQAAHQQRPGDLKAKDFQPAGRGSRTAANEGQVKEQQQGETAPQRVVTQRHAGGRDDRGNVDGHDADRVPPLMVAVQAQPGTYHEPGNDQKSDEAPNLLILEQRAPVSSQCRYIQRKG